MKVGILGLGLIGGSLARAYAIAGHDVYATDKEPSTVSFARLSGAICGELTDERIAECELILLSIYPDGSAAWLEAKAPLIDKNALVIDCCGTKRNICARCFPIAATYGFAFVGGHPMAGSHFSGFKYSKADMFLYQPMVLVPANLHDTALIERAKAALVPCGFGSYCVTTAEDHDRMIAFTSQMPHILSNAYIKSPNAAAHKGISAGSYKDLTRVAWLNPQMWAELFLENKDNVLAELDFYIESLQKYRCAVAEENQPELIALLEEGKRRKEEVDG